MTAISVNIEHTLIATSFVRVFSFLHGPGQHHDPDQERFAHPELIFTLTDRWELRCGRGETIGHSGVVVLGNQGEEYRCRHFGPVPHDRILGVSFIGLTETGDPRVSEWLESFGRPLFTAVAIPLAGDLRWYLRRLLRETTIRPAGACLKVEGICASMLIDVVRKQRLRARGTRQAWRSQRARDAIARARDYIAGHFTEHIELLTLAHEAGVSPFHFARLFKQVSGQSPHQYVLRTRLDRAATLLRDTRASVLEIAISVGFQDATHFARSFRRHTGLTPTHYRKR